MEGPTYAVVCAELHAARQHLYDMVRPLTQDELLWTPSRRDGVSVSYHFGHIALAEDEVVSGAVSEAPMATTEMHACGAHNANNAAARMPAGATIIDYMQRVRERTLGLLALRFRAIRSTEQAIDAAELFRGIINHDYMHTKYIRRICREMGRPDVDAPPSELVRAIDDAVAPPQYRLDSWSVQPGARRSAPPP